MSNDFELRVEEFYKGLQEESWDTQCFCPQCGPSLDIKTGFARVCPGCGEKRQLGGWPKRDNIDDVSAWMVGQLEEDAEEDVAEARRSRAGDLMESILAAKTMADLDKTIEDSGASPQTVALAAVDSFKHARVEQDEAADEAAQVLAQTTELQTELKAQERMAKAAVKKAQQAGAEKIANLQAQMKQSAKEAAAAAAAVKGAAAAAVKGAQEETIRFKEVTARQADLSTTKTKELQQAMKRLQAKAEQDAADLAEARQHNENLEARLAALEARASEGQGHQSPLSPDGVQVVLSELCEHSIKLQTTMATIAESVQQLQGKQDLEASGFKTPPSSHPPGGHGCLFTETGVHTCEKKGAEVSIPYSTAWQLAPDKLNLVFDQQDSWRTTYIANAGEFGRSKFTAFAAVEKYWDPKGWLVNAEVWGSGKAGNLPWHHPVAKAMKVISDHCHTLGGRYNLDQRPPLYATRREVMANPVIQQAWDTGRKLFALYLAATTGYMLFNGKQWEDEWLEEVEDPVHGKLPICFTEVTGKYRAKLEKRAREAEAHRGYPEKAPASETKVFRGTCNNCKEWGHTWRKCPKPAGWQPGGGGGRGAGGRGAGGRGDGGRGSGGDHP